MADPVADTHAADASHGAVDAAHGAAEAAHGAAAGGEHAASFPPFDASLFPSQIFWFVLTFGVLYVIVSTFIVPSVSGVLATRAKTLKTDLDEAAQKGADAQSAREAMEKAVAKARAEARAMIDAARADMQAKLDALNASTTFDKDYMTGQVEAHQNTLTLLQGYAAAGDTPAIKTFAAASAPVVQGHLERARTLNDSLN